MRVKDKRRQEWDRVIAEAREDVPTNDPVGCMEKLKKTGSRLEQLQIGDRIEYKPLAVGEIPDPDLQLREPVKGLHLERMQAMIARLAYKFLLESKIFSEEGIQGNDQMQEQMLEIKSRIQSLMGGFSDLPSFQWTDLQDVQYQREALNQSLCTICRNTTSNNASSVSLMLAKISYNLLVSTSPPGMETYNILLAEFSRLEKLNLAQIVINSFMHESKFKPTRITTQLILDHYQAKRDPKGYRSIVKRMRGTRRVPPNEPKSSPDMRIGKRYVKDLVHPAVQRWAMAHDTIHRYGALHAKAPRDDAILNTQIIGGLKFNGLQAAIREVRSAFRKNHQVREDTLCAVIRVCIDQASFSDGLKIIRVIINAWDEGLRDLITGYSHELRRLIHQLLVMCGFDTSLKSEKDLPIKRSWDALQDLLHFMRIESLSDAVDRYAVFTSTLSHSLGLDISDKAEEYKLQQSLEVKKKSNIDLAMKIVEDFATEEQLRLDDQRKLGIASRWSRLQALEGRMKLRWSEIQALESELRLLLRSSRLTSQKSILSWNTVESGRITMAPSKADEVAVAQADTDASKDQTPVANVREVSITVKESSPKLTTSTPLRRRTPVPAKPFRAPFPVSLPLPTMRGKIELEAFAS
ncbi:hypothetical protein WAI453_002152 [Rhynchosporium graminicola]|uniref:Pentatricopeptide repeat domain-containing protein n=1 Tax=Rhynchosporium graminicola TaxID=2792576 RepID=A0A1E1KWQ7_9HELO|nr:uncharacterized protein RCO7_09386 [Rhynchosporium commune]